MTGWRDGIAGRLCEATSGSLPDDAARYVTLISTSTSGTCKRPTLTLGDTLSTSAIGSRPLSDRCDGDNVPVLQGGM